MADTVRSGSAASGALASTGLPQAPLETTARVPTRVGSARLAKLGHREYSRQELAFHASAMPEWARASREAVMRIKRGEANTWNGSTEVGHPSCERRGMQNFLLDETQWRPGTFNFRAEVLPPSRPVVKDAFGRSVGLADKTPFPRTQVLPSHPALEGVAAGPETKATFTTSTALDAKERAGWLEAARTRCMERSMAHSQRLLERAASVGRGRTSLLDTETQRMETLRAVRAEAEVARASLASHIPTAGTWSGGFGASAATTLPSVGLRASAAASLAATVAHKQAEGLGRATVTLRSASAGPAGPTRRARTATAAALDARVNTLSFRGTHHTGTFGPEPGSDNNQGEGGSDGAGVWSCCGAYGHDSEGCAVALAKQRTYCWDGMT